MALRILSGRFRGRALVTPPGNATRPTMERTRAAIMSMITSRMFLDGTRVLDLFCGSGALGFEALSRGAARLTSVETDARALAAFGQNLRTLGAQDEATALRLDARTFLQRHTGATFDLILADPPYDLKGLDALPDLALRRLDPDGLLVLEHDSRHTFAAHPAFLTAKRYGTTVVSLFAHPDEEGAVDEAEMADSDASVGNPNTPETVSDGSVGVPGGPNPDSDRSVQRVAVPS